MSHVKRHRCRYMVLPTSELVDTSRHDLDVLVPYGLDYKELAGIVTELWSTDLGLGIRRFPLGSTTLIDNVTQTLAIELIDPVIRHISNQCRAEYIAEIILAFGFEVLEFLHHYLTHERSFEELLAQSVFLSPHTWYDDDMVLEVQLSPLVKTHVW